MDSADMLDLRILMCLHDEASHSVPMIELSRTLKEKKYTITRAIDRLEKKGIVRRSPDRVPYLTPEGLDISGRYQERYRIAQNHLLYEGVDPEHARQDACCWTLYCSDQMMEVLRSADERSRIKRAFREETHFSGAALCRKLKNGTYFLPFLIYREQIKENSSLSMANRGFENPCALYVENGVGLIQLRVKSISESSHGTLMDGRVSRLEYLDGGRFIAAEFHGDVISFPASALNFINVGSGMGQILQGSVFLRLQSSVGIANMPQSRALFTIVI